MNHRIEKGCYKRYHIHMIIMSFAFIICIFGQTTIGKAASCNVILSVEEETISVGEAFVLNINIEAEEVIHGVEMMLTYDEDYLQYVTGSPAITNDAGTITIEDENITSESEKKKYVIKFEVKKEGITYLQLGSDATIYNEDSKQSMSVASNVVAINGKTKEVISKDATLESLKVSDGEVSPSFSKDIYEYEVSISQTDAFKVQAKASSKKANVKIDQPDELCIGENKIRVIVEAENGDTKEYILHVTYKPKDDMNKEDGDSIEHTGQEENITTENNQPQNEETIPVQSITASKIENQIVLNTYGCYRIEPLNDTTILPRGYEVNTLLIDGCSVTVYQKPEELSEFVLIYASYEEEAPAFYQYDTKEQTIQRLNQLIMVPEAQDPIVESTVTGIVGMNSSVYLFLLIGLSFLCILFMVLTVIAFKRK